MPGMIYNYNNVYPMSMSPIICSPISVVPVPVAHTLTTPMVVPSEQMTTNNNNTLPSTTLTATSLVHLQKFTTECNNKEIGKTIQQLQRPSSSQATSVKAEPGSGMGSIASASVANKVSIFIFFLYIYKV